MKVLLACERSAGHIFPALALGERMRKESTHSPESHVCKGVDEWLSGSGFRSTKRNLENTEATAVRPRSFTIYFFATSPFLKKYIEKQGFVCFGRSLPL
ncbi:MAG: hypothetical protein KAT96_00945, partial [Candidatus Omnitrophica bacterium]|nr:hypothetical protein [Candidatus Omnitrophota bacterium]